MTTHNSDVTARRHPRRGPHNGPVPSLLGSAKPESDLRLVKGETFHASSRSRSDRDPVLSIKLLPRRSPTCPEALEAIAAGQRRMAHILNNFDLDSLSTPDSPSHKDDFPVPRSSLRHHLKTQATKESPAKQSERRSSQAVKETRETPRRVNCHASDSGLGTSVYSDKTTISSVKGRLTASQVCQASMAMPDHKLSQSARTEIGSRVFLPLFGDEKLIPFHRVVRGSYQQLNNGQLKCLRDVEKSLLSSSRGVKASTALWVDFCNYTIHCVHDTSGFLSGRDLSMPSDAPYTNSYFIDLLAQINLFARLRDEMRERSQRSSSSSGEKSIELVEPKLTLEGGYSKNGRPAELVMHREGKAISMQTGQPYDEHAIPSFKRTLSIDNVDEGVERSMARRKKNAPPMDINQKCRWCDKVLKRPCDLTKHEKTHSRPYKCPYESCKYHNEGFPTEKETERHVNDKHCKNPRLFSCRIPGCSYASKRESNCKQHMEKTHGWTYERTKSNGKNKAVKPSSAQTTPQSSSIPSPAGSHPTVDLSTPPSCETASPSEPPVAMPEPAQFSFADPPIPTAQTEDFQLFTNSPISFGGSPYNNSFADMQAFSNNANFDLGQAHMHSTESPISGSHEILTPGSGSANSPYEPVNPLPDPSMFTFDTYPQAKPEDSMMFATGTFGDVPSMFDQNPMEYLSDPMYTGFLGYDTGPQQLDANPQLTTGLWDEIFP
ncbi:hypothetical protein BDV25DRAFT_164091 [Aspergillus avenaceus]|uniref:C2H2-type domain-containing protein n=1 Tax=Aspergillus avenaceus TaxID=36643 RepID=A0A5N6TH82_ASPAV|nr:hypothetical protein BDV25DRAFT_164091 [Aspergillus avenaceus]